MTRNALDHDQNMTSWFPLVKCNKWVWVIGLYQRENETHYRKLTLSKNSGRKNDALLAFPLLIHVSAHTPKPSFISHCARSILVREGARQDFLPP